MSSTFTPIYLKAMAVLTGQKFAEPDWQKFLAETCGAIRLLGPAGFDPAYAGGLDSIRTKIKGDSKHSNSVAIFFLGGGPGEVIYNAAQNKSSGGSWNDRAATLKMLRHVYRARKSGGQDVWVYAPPKDHGSQVFDELAGADAAQAKKKLGRDSEIFDEAERGLMCDALQLARKIAMDCSIKVTAKSAGAKNAVRRWFMDEKCTKTELDNALAKLATGMNKIAAACNSPSLVFTDYLDWRKARNSYFGGAIPGGEGGGFPVIYLEGAFTRLKGNSGKLWLCAETSCRITRSARTIISTTMTGSSPTAAPSLTARRSTTPTAGAISPSISRDISPRRTASAPGSMTGPRSPKPNRSGRSHERRAQSKARAAGEGRAGHRRWIALRGDPLGQGARPRPERRLYRGDRSCDRQGALDVEGV
jgi:hypothetical protein